MMTTWFFVCHRLLSCALYTGAVEVINIINNDNNCMTKTVFMVLAVMLLNSSECLHVPVLTYLLNYRYLGLFN